MELSAWYNTTIQGKLLSQEHVQELFKMVISLLDDHGKGDDGYGGDGDGKLKIEEQLLMMSVMYNTLKNGQSELVEQRARQMLCALLVSINRMVCAIGAETILKRY